MINPSLILDGFVAHLRDIPALVAEMGGNSANVVAFRRRFPDQTNFRKFVSEQVGPKMIWTWDGQLPGISTSMEVWKHNFIGILIPPVESSVITDVWIHRVWRLIVKGVPASGGGIPMDQIEPHESVLPMDIPSIQWLLGEEPGIDVAQASVTFTEKGDY